MNKFKVTRRNLLLIICIFTSSMLQGQSRKDTLFSSDTMTVRSFKKTGKVARENNYVQGKRIAVKYWYYNKDGYGYRIYDKSKTQPKKKLRREFYPDGKLKMAGSTIKGKMNGEFKSYYSNGKSQCDCNYKNGKRDSIQIKHFENGQVNIIANYKDGKEDGKTTYYFDNGQTWSEIIYKDGKPWEVLTNFDKNGSAMEKGTLKDGNGTLFIYDEDRKLTAIENYKEGKLIKREKKSNREEESRQE